jgi:hypothetical protein
MSSKFSFNTLNDQVRGVYNSLKHQMADAEAAYEAKRDECEGNLK